MDFLLEKFDDGSGVIRTAQEDTYDTYMEGANTFIGSYYVTALRASARMAVLMGDAATAKKYGERAELASKNYEKECWNEEFGYYCGAPLSYKGPPCPITPAGAKFGNRTYGGQCFIDQLCAVGLSTAAGLGCCFDPAHEAAARSSVLKNNTIGPQRTVKPIVAHFAQGDSGIIVCTNPHNTSDGNPNDGHMVSSGFESPLLASMLFDRNIQAALTGVSMLRRRCDGTLFL